MMPMNFIIAKKTSKQSVEDSPWFLLSVYRKMLKERVDLKKELLSKKQPELEDLENSQSIHIAKNEKARSEESTKGVAEQIFDKKKSWVRFIDLIRHFYENQKQRWDYTSKTLAV